MLETILTISLESGATGEITRTKIGSLVVRDKENANFENARSPYKFTVLHFGPRVWSCFLILSTTVLLVHFNPHVYLK